MPQEIYQHTFANGLTLLAERMPHVQSASFNFLVPAGCAFDPPRHPGIASVLSNLITRGAGDRDSRQLTLALDNLGLDRDETVGTLNMHFRGATLARSLPQGLELYADILRRPHLPADELAPARALALQDLQSLEDEPRNKLYVELRHRYYPAPLSHDYRGSRAGIESLTPEIVRHHFHQRVQPRGTILSIAGNIDWNALRDLVERLFGDWQPRKVAALTLKKIHPRNLHLPKETTQTQIGIAFPSVPFGHREYYAALGAVNVLSGGMSARLFTEVREKRGLCYAVSASYETFKDRGTIICYAGSTNERAQETLDVTLHELQRLRAGIEKEEVERVQAGLKSSLIMQEESTFARARSLASDWYFLGRIRPVEEISAAINALSPRSIVAHLDRHPPENFCIVTLGPKPLRVKTPKPSIAANRDGHATSRRANAAAKSP